METPRKLSPAETLQRIADYLNRQSHQAPGDRLRHYCGFGMRCRRAAMSFHIEALGDKCAGAGRVLCLLIPYCPVCEPLPAEYGCIHISNESIPILLLPPTVEGQGHENIY